MTLRDVTLRGTTDSVSLRETGARAPGWNAEAAKVLRATCRLSGDALARNLSWWKRLRERGQAKGIGDADIAAAIRGLPQVMRVDPPWWPCRVFCRKNQALWLEAMSAGRKLEEREARQIGTAPLIAELRRLAKEAQG